MEKVNNFKIWMAQIRSNFLILAVFLVIIGLAFSLKYPSQYGTSFSIMHAFMLICGVVLSHISVNLFNEYSDFKTKIDYYTNRIHCTFNGKTKFSKLLMNPELFKIKLEHKNRPYSKGDHDFYIVELEPFSGYFMILHESILIEKGYIKTNIQPAYNYTDFNPKKRKIGRVIKNIGFQLNMVILVINKINNHEALYTDEHLNI